jgi:hypothetical protein
MSLVRRYVHESGGKIALASLPGRDTRFKIILPPLQVEAGSPEAGAAGTAVAASPLHDAAQSAAEARIDAGPLFRAEAEAAEGAPTVEADSPPAVDAHGATDVASDPNGVTVVLPEAEPRVA